MTEFQFSKKRAADFIQHRKTNQSTTSGPEGPSPKRKTVLHRLGPFTERSDRKKQQPQTFRNEEFIPSKLLKFKKLEL